MNSVSFLLPSLMGVTLACCAQPEPERRTSTASQTTENNGEEAHKSASLSHTPVVRSIFESRKGVCIRFVDGDFRCIRVVYEEGGFGLVLHERYVDGSGPMNRHCLAEGKIVFCNIFDRSVWPHRAERHTYEFPFEPTQLHVLAGEHIPIQGGGVQLGPERICARSKNGEVLCMSKNTEHEPQRVFGESAGLYGTYQELYSLGDDGTLSCIGDTLCPSFALARFNRFGQAGGGRVGGIASRLKLPRSPLVSPDDYRASYWPGPITKRHRIQRAMRLPKINAQIVHSTNPVCVTNDVSDVWCWEYHRGPQRYLVKSEVDDFVPWGLRFCTRSGDQIECIVREDDGSLSDQALELGPLAFRVEGAERLLNIQGRLCVIDGTRTLSCRSSRGNIERSISLAKPK